MKKFITVITLLYLLSTFGSGCVGSEVVMDSQISLNEDISNENIIERMSIEEYFVNNSVPIEFETEYPLNNLKMIDSELEASEIFFTAEMHGIKANNELKMEFLKYFKEKTAFKYFLCETSYSMSYFLNQYLNTGDESILEQIYSPLKGTYASNKESYNNWIELYEFNKTLSGDNKIQVIGVDIEHQVINAYRFLVAILPEKEAPEEIKETIAMIKETFEMLETTFTKDYIATKNSKIILDDIDQNRDLYNEYLEDELIYFELVNRNVLNSKDAYKKNGDYVEWNNIRDRMIYENFITIDNTLPKNKYYGQWGMNHTYQSKEKDIMWFGSYLNSEDSAYNGKILTIAYNYIDSERMGRGGKPATDYNFVFPFVKETHNFKTEKYILYKLNGNEIDRPEIPMIDTYSGEELEEDIKEFIQYIVLIKDSEATQSLN